MSFAVLATTSRQRSAGGSGYRAPNEFYPTPPAAVRALLSVESFDGSIWEPACGNGAMAEVLQDAGYDVVSTDLIDYDYGTGGLDFLAERQMRAKHIVTNPPYGSGLADAFLRQALHLAKQTGGSVAMLLNLASLCHPMRHDMWLGHPPTVIYALDQLICWPCGDPSLATSSLVKQRYCWVVWKPGHIGPTTFGWLSTGAFS